MATLLLPPGVATLMRDEIIRRACRDWKLWHLTQDPDAVVDVGKGTVPNLVARVLGDALTPVYANIAAIGRAWLIRNTFGERLDLRVAEHGLTRQGQTPATGYIQIETVAGGGNVVAGDVLTYEPTGVRYETRATALYQNGQYVQVAALDLGTQGNLDPGVRLTWRSPRSGVLSSAEVVRQANGLGLSGGREQETDQELQERLIARLSNPPASGNSADYLFELENNEIGLPIQRAFVYPALFGPGTVGFTFLLRPDAFGSREPNTTQIGEAEALLRAAFAVDDGIFGLFVLPAAIQVALQVTWRSSVPGWLDAQPWPIYGGASSVAVSGTVAPTNTTARVTTVFPQATPQPGQTIALYDTTTATFKRKRIAAGGVSVVVPTLTWDLTFETTAGASDAYVPVAGQLVSPWSDSLNAVPAPVVTYFGTLGVGEVYASLPDPGRRQRRYPASQDSYPNVIASSDLEGYVKDTGVTSDVRLSLPSTPYPTPVGLPGSYVRLLKLGDLAVYPQ